MPGAETLEAQQRIHRVYFKNLEAIGPVEVGRFFGGVGLSNGFLQFAMIMGNSLYFATDENSRKNTNKQECSRFRI